MQFTYKASIFSTCKYYSLTQTQCTFWYHDHNYMIYTLFGPLIILEKDFRMNAKSPEQDALIVSDYGGSYYPLRDLYVSNYQPILLPKFQFPPGLIGEIQMNASFASMDNFTIDSMCFNGRCESTDPTIKVVESAMSCYMHCVVENRNQHSF